MSITHCAALAALLALTSPPLAAQTAPQLARPSLATSPKYQTLYAVDGEIHGDRFGAAIATLPDLDGDGQPELLVGAPNRQPVGMGTKGHVYVLSGASGAVLRTHDGWSKGDRLGHAVASLPDLDGDGVPDYGGGAVWAVNIDDPDGPASPGVVGLWSGATGAALDPLVGSGTWECFGAALDALGDIDGDGVGDLLVTARFGGAPGGDALEAPGHVRLLSGATGATLGQVVGPAAGDCLGYAAITLPDLNGDGLPDIAAGAWPATEGQGLVELLSGADGALLGHFDGHAHRENFGYALAVLPDLDGDGLAELAVGAPAASFAAGRVTVLSPASGQTLFTIEGHVAGQRLGMAVAAIGDRDGDGITELAIGAPFWSGSMGRVLIVSPPTGTIVAVIAGHVSDSNFGETLRTVPDLTGDGLDELAIGAPLSPSADSDAIGRVVVVSLH